MEKPNTLKLSPFLVPNMDGEFEFSSKVSKGSYFFEGLWTKRSP